MDQERRKTPRYPFVASAEVTEERSAAVVKMQVSELSMHGCYLDTINPLAKGEIVSVKIYTESEFFESRAIVVYSHSHLGMGLTFQEVKPPYMRVLQKWILAAMQAKQRMEGKPVTPDGESSKTDPA